MSKQITGGVVDTHTGIFTAGTLCCQRYTGKAAMATSAGTNYFFRDQTFAKEAGTSLSLTGAELAVFAPNVATNVVLTFTTGGTENQTLYADIVGIDQFGNTVSETLSKLYNTTVGTSGVAGTNTYKKLLSVRYYNVGAWTADLAYVYFGYGSVIGLLRSITDKYDVISWMNGTTEVARGDMTASVAAITNQPLILRNTITSTTAQAASTNVIYYYTTDREHHKVK